MSSPLIEAPRQPQERELAALREAVRLAPEIGGPVPALLSFDGEGKVTALSSSPGAIVAGDLERVPVWAVVERPSDADVDWVIRIGGPDSVFEFHVRGDGAKVVTTAPSPTRVAPSEEVVKRANSIAAAVFRAGGMLHRNDRNETYETFLATAGDETPVARAFSGICHPACKLREYSAACLTEEGWALIEVGSADAIFAFSQKGSHAPLVWHRVRLRA